MNEKSIPVPIRENIVNAAFIGLSILMAPLVVSSIVRAFHFGWSNLYIFHFSVLLVVLTTTLFRGKISYHFKTHLLCLIFVVISFWNAYLYSFSGGYYMFIGAVVFATLIYGRSIGILYASISLIGIMTINLLHIKNIISLQVDFNIFNNSFNTWISTMIGLFIIILVIIYSVGKFYDYYIITIFHLEEKTNLLEESIQQLAAKEVTLEMQNNELIHLNQQYLIAKEKAEESDRLKTAFLQNMSHEIRTPMNAIMGFSQLIANNKNNKDKIEQYASIINMRSNDLLSIVNDILDISRIETQQLNIQIEKFSLKSFFHHILENEIQKLQKKYGKKNNTIELKINHDYTDLKIETDKGKLKQIFINLISNAFKFTENGKIEIGYFMLENNEIDFFVSDTGVGIPLDKQEFIFERFTRLDTASNRIAGGNGLGLALVKGLCNLLDGKVWLKSEPSIGSTFFFTVGHVYSDNIILENTSGIRNVQNKKNSKKIVLIVDDDTYNTALLEEILSSKNLEINIAENGSKAIDLTKKLSPDLILMDIGLPDINGYEVIKNIFQNNPSQKIIVQTAYAQPSEREFAIQQGCVDYISKPLNLTLLVSMVQKHLNIETIE